MTSIKISPSLIKKSTSQLIKIATRHFNQYIRLRDSEADHFICISCQRPKALNQINAGHYYPTTKSATRFNPLNVHAQCIQCNMYKHGNLVEYRKHLISKIGQDRYDMLEIASRGSKRWDKFELIAIIEEYKHLVRQQKKMYGLSA